MSSAVSLALLSVNLVGLALTTYCANSAIRIGYIPPIELESGYYQSQSSPVMEAALM